MTSAAVEPLVTLDDAQRRSALRHRYPLGFLIARRILACVVTLIVATILIFLALRALPGDVAAVVLGRNATPELLAQVQQQLGTHTPLYQQYFKFLGNLVTGDLGESTAGLVQGVHTPLSTVVGPAFANSAVLAAITMMLFVPLALGLGLWSGVRAYRRADHIISMTSLAISALPEFLVATALITVFFSWLGWLPPISSIPQGSSPLAHPASITLPILTLLIVSLAFGSRMLRAAVIDVMAQDYVAMARLAGFSEGHVLRKYVLPNALIPTIQIFAQQLQYLIGGIIIVEAVFNYPGIGTALVRGIAVRDTQQVLVIATILAAVYIAINLVADVICILLDPKIRTAL